MVAAMPNIAHIIFKLLSEILPSPKILPNILETLVLIHITTNLGYNNLGFLFIHHLYLYRYDKLPAIFSHVFPVFIRIIVLLSEF